MNLCSDGHEEVCYEGRSCPACDFKEKLSDCETDLSNEKEERKSLDDKVSELEEKISELESQIEKEK